MWRPMWRPMWGLCVYILGALEAAGEGSAEAPTGVLLQEQQGSPERFEIHQTSLIRC